MRTLTFEQITDDRFDNDIDKLLAERIDKIISALKDLNGVHMFHDGIRRISFDDNEQCRCHFWVRKDNRKITWNDIYRVINSVKPVPYKFVEYSWNDINSSV